MNTSNATLITLAFVFCFVLVACSGNAGNTNTVSGAQNSSQKAASDPSVKAPYPQSVKDEFLKSCVDAGSDAKFCACVLDKVQDKYSLEEFSVIESKIAAGTPPDEFVEFSGKARAQCISR